MAQTVRLHPLAVAALKELQRALEADYGLSATYEEIAAGLYYGTPPSHASGMLVAFNKHAASVAGSTKAAKRLPYPSDEAEEEEEEDSDSD